MEDFRKSYGSLYAAASAATAFMLVIIPIQIVVFALTPIPGSPEAWFELFYANPLLGFFHADFFILVDNILIAEWRGTAFDVYYVLNGVALLVVSARMLGDRTFGRTTAYWGLASGIFMTVPSTAGTVGLVFSLLSLVPWYVFSVRFGLVFLRIARGTAGIR